MTKTMLLGIVVVFTILQPGNPLSCYKCNGCETTSVVKETCRNADPDANVVACLTQKIHDRDIPDSMTIKKCIVYGKDQPFKCPELPNSDTASCDRCQHDYCNSAPNIKTGITTFLLALLIKTFQL